MKTFAILASASLVAGHGYVNNATLGGTAYTFYQPYTDPYTSPTPERVSRPIQGNGPVTDLSYQDLQCGGDTVNGIVGSSPANLTATVEAGATIDLYWTLWPTSHVGPSLTYMAKCDNDDCSTFMPQNESVWFKIQEQGRTGTSDTWGTTAIMTAGGYISYTVPACIESGAYLVRHEVIALHSAGTEGGAQFYPGCHQIKVTGGTGASTPSDLVAFPGAYSAQDPGILYNAYAATTYTIPGPELFSCSGSSSAASTSASSGSASAAVTSATSAATSAETSSSFTTVTTSSAAVNVAAAAPTDASATDDGCDAEETVTSTLSVAASTSTADAAAATSTDSSSDDGCDAEGSDGSDTVTTGAATGSSTTGTTTGSDSSSADGSDDDTCDDEPTATGSGASQPTGGYGGSQPSGSYGAQPTGSYGAQPSGSAASGSDGEDCDAVEEQSYARRFSGRFARGM